MASTYSNLFDLLGGDETDDNVSDLYERLKKKADEEVPSSPKTRRQYIVFAENSENVDSKEEARVNGKENGTKSDEEGWKVVTKRVKKFQEYGNENANGDGSEQIKENGDLNGNGNRRGGKKRRSGKRGKGSVRYGNGDNGEVQDSSNVGNGDGVESVVADHPIVNSEVDAGVTVEDLNGEETKETETTEVVRADVPEPEETAEQRKERLIFEQKKKEDEERAEKRRVEAEEEAKKMTLDQYEKILLEKKQSLNVEKAKPTRVVSADEEFDNMKLVGKKLDNDEILIVEKEKPKGKGALAKSTSESKLEKSESFDKGTKSEKSEEKSESFDKGTKSLAVDLAELFQPKPFRPPFFRGGRSWRRERNHENQGGVVHRRPSQNGSTRNKLPRKNGPPNKDVLEDKIQFPVLGFVPPVLPPESSAPPANPTTPSEPNSSESSEPLADLSTLSEPNSADSSAPPANPTTSSEPNSAESSAPPANPSTSSGPNKAAISHRYQNRKRRQKNKGNRSTTSGAKTASAIRSATAAAANSSVTAER